MKLLALSDIEKAFTDEPLSIGERLVILGIEREALGKLFAEELLATSVYGSSFLKFFQENVGRFDVEEKIPPDVVLDDFVNPYQQEQKPIGQRLSEIGFSSEDKLELFGEDILSLYVTGEEFMDFLTKNNKKLLGKVEQFALKELPQDAAQP